MDVMNKHIHPRRAANGIAMLRGAVMAGLLVSTLLTALTSVTFADGRDGNRRDDKGRHSLVQHPYAANVVKNPFETLQAQIDALKAQVNQLTVDNSRLKDDAQAALNAAKIDISAMQVSVKALEMKPAGIVNLDKYVKIDTNPINGVTGPHILITGANVHVRSGSGFTDDNFNSGGAPTGLGNLIVGYNEQPLLAGTRTGSHNLVGGSMNSFGSVGGMVFGLRNTLNGQYAAIVSGDTNAASGVNASVLGGSGNTASGLRSTVYGSLNLTAVNQNSYMPQAGRATGN